MQLPSVIGAQRCSSGWLRQEGLKEAKAACLTRAPATAQRLMCGLAEFLKSGTKMRRSLGEPMASAMVIGIEDISECVEELYVKAGRSDIEDCFGECIWVWFDCDGALTELSLGCVKSDGVRYWMLVCRLVGATDK